MALTPHPSLPDYYDSSYGWSFSLHPEEDGEIEYVEKAILAWQEWLEFLRKRESDASSQPLFED